MVPPPKDDAARPGEKWQDEIARLPKVLDQTRREIHRSQTAGRRGNFTCITAGISHGQGQKKPTNLKDADIAQKVFKHRTLHRIAGFQSGINPLIYRCR